jgi:hypothetical protein
MKTDATITKTELIPEPYRGKVYMRRCECASVSGLSVDFYDRLAWQNKGPKFIKTSKRGPCLYPVAEFFTWLAGLGNEPDEREEVKPIRKDRIA